MPPHGDWVTEAIGSLATTAAILGDLFIGGPKPHSCPARSKSGITISWTKARTHVDDMYFNFLALVITCDVITSRYLRSVCGESNAKTLRTARLRQGHSC